MGHVRKNSIGKNVFHLFYSTAFSSGLNAFTLVVLANYLESSSYGMFSIALAFSLIMGYFTDVGMSVTMLREGSKKGISLSTVISSYIKIRLVLLGVTFVGGFFFIQLLYQDQPELMQTMYYLIFPMVIGLTMQSISVTYFQLVEEMQYSGLIRMCSAVFLVISISLGMFFSLKPTIIALLYGCSYLFAGMGGMYLTSKRVEIRFKSAFHKDLLKNMLSFIISGLLIVILPQLGPLVLEKTLTLKQVGFFAVAYRIPSALYQIPGVLAGAFYPVLFKSYNSKGGSEHLQLNILQLKMMALTGMAMTVPLYYMPEIIIHSLFGEKWLFASSALQILSFMLVLQSINVALADGLTTKALQTRRTIVQAVAVAGGIGFYTFFSRQYGVEGAAFAGIAVEILSFAGFWLLNPKRGEIAKKVLLPYISTFIILLAVITHFLSAQPISAVALHLLCLLIIIGVDPELARKLISFINQKKNFEKKQWNGR
ncbi:oligosaccharide flippase family protein [Domibacillus aminovorans]|uniref:oligosaccharide flippase family protein n=1 Tax=Domibacillus aminovorans TaxID=29332 RepID=UPI0007C7C9E5|nr:oligosaccharide flippase family protein [Domibacillus aminovorans]